MQGMGYMHPRTHTGAGGGRCSGSSVSALVILISGPAWNTLQVLEDNGGGGSCRSALMPAEPGRLMAHHCISLKTMTKICTTPR